MASRLAFGLPIAEPGDAGNRGGLHFIVFRTSRQPADEVAA